MVDEVDTRDERLADRKQTLLARVYSTSLIQVLEYKKRVEEGVGMFACQHFRDLYMQDNGGGRCRHVSMSAL